MLKKKRLENIKFVRQKLSKMKHIKIKGLEIIHEIIHEAPVRQFQTVCITKTGVLEKEEEGEVIETFEERIAGIVFQLMRIIRIQSQSTQTPGG